MPVKWKIFACLNLAIRTPGQCILSRRYNISVPYATTRGFGISVQGNTDPALSLETLAVHVVGLAFDGLPPTTTAIGTGWSVRPLSARQF